MTRRMIALACLALVACATITAAADSTTESLASPGYSVGFDLEHKLLRDYARAAEARAQMVGTDFNHIAVVAAKAAERETPKPALQQAVRAVVQKQAVAAAVQKKAAAAVVQKQAAVAVAQKQVAAAVAQKTVLHAATTKAVAASTVLRKKAEALAKVAVTPAAKKQAVVAMKAAVKAEQVAKRAVKAEAKAAVVVAKKAAVAKVAVAKAAVAKAAVAKAAVAKAAVAKTAVAAKATVATKAAAAAKPAAAAKAAKAAAPKPAAAAPVPEKAVPLLARESSKLRIPDWPSLNDPANVAADVLVRSRGIDNGAFEQQDGSKTSNILSFPKFSGRQSYSEHFQEWPEAKAAADPIAAAKIQAKAIQEFKRQKFLGKPVVAPPSRRVVTPVAKAKPQTAIEKAKAGVLKPNPVPVKAAPVAGKATAVAPTTPAVQTPTPPAVQTPTLEKQNDQKKESKTVTPPPPVIEKEKPFNPWLIVAIIIGSLVVCLCGAGLYMLLRKKPQQGGAELDGYHQV